MNPLLRPTSATLLAALLCATHAWGQTPEQPSAEAPATGPTNKECEARANDTVAKLLECIRKDPLWKTLSAFQDISDAHPGSDGHGNRDTGTAGYKASVDHVAAKMKKAGYKVTVQKYNYTTSVIDGVPHFGASDREFTLGKEWFVARLSAGGTLAAPIQPLGGTGTGCHADDFAGFVPGHIALLQRGPCAYDTQVARSQAAGAKAVIVYNNRHQLPAATEAEALAEPAGAGGGGAFELRLTTPATIPVIGAVSYAVGARLAQAHARGEAPLARVDIRTRAQAGVDYNLIAESPFGDTNSVVVVEGHLDSIYGAGMLDNASGSATILEIALKLAKTPTRNQLRYVWFGGEEIGLLGSRYYTKNLTTAQRNRIAFDVDADVTATPNFDYLVADPANASNVDRFPDNVVPESKIGNQFFADYFASVGIPSRAASFGNDGTDSNSFSLVGIPNTGILTQQNCCKRSWEVDIWGGVTGNYEGKIPGTDGGCVDRSHRWCDNLSNNDPVVLEVASKATAYAVFNLANHTFTARQR
ncbi:M28 family peptidase [Ideonella sp.]|uniref:M28 family peptidase n=1 Tax=Ideonella sp. TaxID=1929293 RepID=UPI0035AF9621